MSLCLPAIRVAVGGLLYFSCCLEKGCRSGAKGEGREGHKGISSFDLLVASLFHRGFKYILQSSFF